MSNHSHRRPLRLEGLEERQLMAGDVTATLSGKTLVITATNSEDIVFIGSDSQGRVVVAGSDDSDTTINGDEYQTFSKVNDIVINMLGGDDYLGIGDLTVKGSITAQLGNGDNFILLGDAVADGTVEPDSSIPASFSGELNVKKVLTVIGGADNDEIGVGGVTVGNAMTVNAGTGDNRVVFDGQVGATSVKQALTIVTAGSGENVILLEDITSKNSIVVSTGSGRDEVGLLDVTAKYVTVSTGAGDDVLEVEDNTVTKLAVFEGGPGDNAYLDEGGNSFKKLIKTNFTTVV